MNCIRVIFLYALFSGCSGNQTIIDKNQEKGDEVINKTLIEEEKDIISPKGSQLLQKSHKSFTFYNLTGYWLTSVDYLACDDPISEADDKDYYTNHQINFIQLTDSTMEISFSFIAKCSSDFLFEIELVDKDVLNIIYHGYRSLVECNCEYNIKYLLIDRDYLDGFEMDNVKLKHISINNSRKELISNYLNDN